MEVKPCFRHLPAGKNEICLVKEKKRPYQTAPYRFLSRYTRNIRAYEKSCHLGYRYSYHKHAKTITYLIFSKLHLVFTFICRGIPINIGGNAITENRIFEKK